MQFIRKISNFIQRPTAGGRDPVKATDVTEASDGHALWKEAKFAEPYPLFHVVAPGRVNLIGEHIDHQNYNVLPCAVEKAVHIFLSVEPNTDKSAALEIRHVDCKKFTSKMFSKLSDIKIDSTHHWTNYIVASYLGMTEYYLIDKDVAKNRHSPQVV
eukprot:Protomagalhaensia_wolfi_Nauph_80__380@NODE_120_length_3581_cov_237_449181_g92_i0_p4_GENE_NODE_120_length_3581_cov_237_449181_g92_i0NODE_120_length_3581_cov_237_449181_g92_i0_p4_ORF_typecomplete_len157_score13_21GalKase_gal_bdg/PF10509_9/2_8e17_NODE_120_length_3581_cov_237_449181_g92_i09211391